MLDQFSTSQKVVFGALALGLVGGGAYAYRLGLPQLARLVQDNKGIVMGVVALGSLPLWLPYAQQAHDMLPEPLRLGSVHLGSVHLGSVHMNPMGAIALGAIDYSSVQINPVKSYGPRSVPSHGVTVSLNPGRFGAVAMR